MGIARSARPSRPPQRVLRSSAPTRICDIGGWTDTWFSGHGRVVNIAVSPCARVVISVQPLSGQVERVILNVADFQDRYALTPGAAMPNRHPLFEACVDEIGVPDDVAVEITIQGEVPPGCSMGTSAAVTVALIGALDQLSAGRLTAHEVAVAAHRVEADRLGLQTGVQDHIAAAYGGLNFIDIVHYPTAEVAPIFVSDSFLAALERRLLVIFLGRAHLSSAVHQTVIARLHESSEHPLQRLRELATEARSVLLAEDLDGLGAVMVENTRCQERLHPGLVSAAAHDLIAIASEHGATGWKVNGAGGDGGSVTILCSDDAGETSSLLAQIMAAGPGFRQIPIALSREGLRVWETV